MSRSCSIAKRAVIGLGLVVTFAVMASVFNPDRTRAMGPRPVPRLAEAETSSSSTDPHEGLHSLGALEHNSYILRIYATERGPRYSLYDAATGRELGVLMTPQQVRRWFPDLPLPDDFAGTGPLMMVDDQASGWMK